MSVEAVVENLFSIIVSKESASETGFRYTLYKNQSQIYSGGDLTHFLAVLERAIEYDLAYWADDEFIFVHAGAVKFNGKAIVLPGKSGAGKSTLVKKLVDAGAEYYSDDMAIFNSKGFVLPYPSPISLRDTSNPARKTRHMPDRVGTAPIEVGVVICSEYSSKVKRWQPR